MQIRLDLAEVQNVRKKWIGNKRAYTALTDDPQLIYTASDGDLFESNVVALSVDFQSADYVHGSAKIYIDRGQGFSEVAGSWEPALLQSSGNLIAIIYEPNTVRRLRIDPIETAGQFEIGAPILSDLSLLTEIELRAYMGFAAAQAARAANLLDFRFYRDAYGLSGTDLEIFTHFSSPDHAMHCDPNFAFHSQSYFERNSINSEHEAPIHHYIRIGEESGCSPSDFFDLTWYCTKYGSGLAETALGHFLRHRAEMHSGSLPEIDPIYYLDAYPDIKEAGRDPSEHFLTMGHCEDRQPNAWFQSAWYRDTYLKGEKNCNPLLHYRLIGRHQGYRTSPITQNGVAHSTIIANSKPSLLFEERMERKTIYNSTDIQVLAFYLPQFHPFEENDKWWGHGFTEWTNVARGSPRYVGHHQPRIPRDLGFYDLRNIEVTLAQEKLAKAHGISAFVYYYYWFDGKRIMDLPLNNKIESKDATFPFALLWANENWTRTWDGGDADILIAQNYRREDDQLLINDIARYMKDNRYLLVAGRPILFIYRPSIIKDATETFTRWREIFVKDHGLNPIIVMAQFGDDLDPRPYGLDGAMEFPPHKIARNAPDYRSKIDIIDPDFVGTVHKYEEMIERSLSEEMPEYQLIKSVFPSWDNDARRQRNSTSYMGSTPQLYETWLRGAIRRAKDRPFFGHPIVAINAWNEWAEGCYLEPDVHYGAAYLNATARAIEDSVSSSKVAPLLIGHDAHHHGAQRLLLNITKMFVESFGVDPRVVLLGPGPLLTEYAKLAPTVSITDVASFNKYVENLGQASRSALLNTTPGCRYIASLKQKNFHTVALIHELPTLIRQYHLESVADDIAKHSDVIIFPASRVLEDFSSLVSRSINQAQILPQGLFDDLDIDDDQTRRNILDQLGIEDNGKIVINAAYGDLRKGFDIFLQTAILYDTIDPTVHFIWVGIIESELNAWLLKGKRKDKPYRNVSLVGFRDDLAAVLSSSDVFLLTSREDPFPTVLLDALACGLPVVAMRNAGGFVDLFANKFVGDLVDFGDVSAICSSIQKYLSIPDDKKTETARARREFVKDKFNFKEYCFALLKEIGGADHRVSVIVPNYNYENHLGERFRSIFEQSYPIYECKFLDDASSDASVSRAKELCSLYKRKVDIILNKVNSGNVFSQWRKGISACSGDLIWIAEADDSCQSSFLKTAVEEFTKNPNLAFVLTDSVAVDEAGVALLTSYKDYQLQMGSEQFSEGFVEDARSFAAKHLSVCNLILNVSSVVWRSSVLIKVLNILEGSLDEYRLAGDWRIYVEACACGGDVGYVAQSLNVHRRHSKSVTGKMALAHQAEEVERVQSVVIDYFGDLLDDGRRSEMKRYVEKLRNGG